MRDTTHALLQAVSRAPVIPVVTIDDAGLAPDLASALLHEGLPVIEVTLRTPHALDAIRAIARQVPEAYVVAGTITTPSQIGEAIDAGAQALVTPGTSSRLAEALAGAPVPALPGCASVSEALTLMELGFDVLKLFPASVVGGPSFLKAIHGPLPSLRFCPTGGIDVRGARDYLACPNVVCVGGTWVTPKAALASRDLATIRDLARKAAALPRAAGAPPGSGTPAA